MLASLPILMINFVYYNRFYRLSYLYLVEGINVFLFFVCFTMFFFVKMPFLISPLTSQGSEEKKDLEMHRDSVRMSLTST